jgi:uncharacterized protein YqfB (UPF0267 family)
MKKLTVDQLGKIKTIAYIPTIEEKYRKQSILIEFKDNTVTEYIFETYSGENYKSIESFAEDMFDSVNNSSNLSDLFDMYKKDVKLKNIIQKIYPDVKNVYVADL